MLPTYSRYRLLHSSFRNVVPSGELFMRVVSSFIKPSCCQHVLRCQFGFALPSAELSGFSPLLNHVVKVIFLRSEKQVIRSYARRIIATVKDAESRWNHRVVNHPRKLMGANVVKTTVAANVAASYPNPTRFSFSNLGPKARLLIAGLAHSLAGDFARAIPKITKRFGFSADDARSFVYDRISQGMNLRLGLCIDQARGGVIAPSRAVCILTFNSL